MPDSYKLRDFDPPIAVQVIEDLQDNKGTRTHSKNRVYLAYELWISEGGFLCYRLKNKEETITGIHFFKPYALPEQQEIDITLT